MRIVFSDLDGTLLASDKSLHPRTMGVLDELARQGIEFVPCSGRPLAGLPADLLTHPAVNYAVCGNGALVYRVDKDAKTGEVAGGVPLHVEPMPLESVLALYEVARDREVLFDVFGEGVVYAERFRYDHVHEMGIDPAFVPVLTGSRKLVDVTIPELARGFRQVERVTVFWKHPEDKDAILSAVRSDPALIWVNSLPTNIEISSREATKGSALTWLCAHLGFEAADSVAFGDGNNDAPMLAAAGDGVAMANAVPETKAAADHIAQDNDAPGVALYLEGLLGL